MERNSYKYDGIDFTGFRNNRLEVIEKANKGRSWWVCKCDCGNIVTVRTCHLFTRQSCGCFEKENKKNFGERSKIHGKTNTRLYGIWCGMKDRCYNENTEHYDRYGGRGIKICELWRNDFQAFYNWAMANGYKNDLSIDRINANGNYEPGNCRWVDWITQSRNKEHTRTIEYHNKNIPITEFMDIVGITYEKFVMRKLKAGMSAEEIEQYWKDNHETDPDYIKINEAAKYFNVHVYTIRNWIKKGLFKSKKKGGKLYILKNQERPVFENRDIYGRSTKRIEK